MIALIDCNNFFVSCERVFNPKLNNKPVIVTSGNGGCVIARSNEAKALGIPMGEPLFKIKNILKKDKVHILSSNHELYHDLSNRIFNIIQEMFPFIDVYSIDEAFIDLKGVNDIFYSLHTLQEKILKGVGIPTTIGIATTKTLAKVTNNYAKKRGTPLLQITDFHKNFILQNLKVEDIWGIGKNTSLKLKSLGIVDALSLMQQDPKKMRKICSIITERTVLELRGISTLDLNDIKHTQKSIQHSRSFVEQIKDKNTFFSIFSSFIEELSKKLREGDLKTKSILIYAKSSPFLLPIHIESKTILLPFSLSDPIEIMKVLHDYIDSLFKENINFKKIGVIFNDLSKEEHNQTFFLFKTPLQNNETLLKAVDAINQKFGKRSIHLSSSMFLQKQEELPINKSQNFTTSWNDLLKVG